MQISIINDLQGNDITQIDMPWSELVDKCKNPTIYASKKDMPLIKLAVFGSMRSQRGSLRHDANISAITGIECDYDAGLLSPGDASDMLGMYGVKSCIYTTPSHTHDAPRWRVLFPTSTQYQATDRRTLTGIANAMLAGVLAPESFTLSQSFYIGRVDSAQYVCYETHGEYIDLVAGVSPIFPTTPARDFKPAHDVDETVIAEIIDALRFVNADSRETWVAVGCALVSLGDVGYKIWDDWSKASPKYDPDDMWRWKTFTADRTDFRSIFAKATIGGWINPRAARTVDTAEVFKSDVKAFDWPSAIVPFDSPCGGFNLLHITANNKPKATIENLQHILERYGIVCYYDELLKKQYMILPDGNNVENDCSDNGKLETLKSIVAVNDGTDALVSRLPAIFMRTIKNPIKDFIFSKPWDGTSRIADLCAAIEVEKSEELYRVRVVTMWLVQCVAALDGAEHSPILHKKAKYETVLVFRGAQGKFKTSFFQSLVPRAYSEYIRDGVQLNLDDKDSVKNAVSGWIVELGELDGTLKKSDSAKLKGFLSNGHDTLRLPYDKLHSNFQRRTSFCGSVNGKRFLIDPTGNRRFAVIEVCGGNYMHGVDMQQLWAEVWALYVSGVQWWPDDALAAEIAEHHSQHTKVNFIEDALRNRYDLDEKQHGGVRMTCTEIMLACNIPHTNYNLNELKDVLERYGHELGTYQGKRGYRLKQLNYFDEG